MIIRLFIGNPTASEEEELFAKSKGGPPLNSRTESICSFLLAFFYLWLFSFFFQSSDRFIKRLLVQREREREPVYIDDYIYERGVYAQVFPQSIIAARLKQAKESKGGEKEKKKETLEQFAYYTMSIFFFKAFSFSFCRVNKLPGIMLRTCLFFFCRARKRIYIGRARSCERSGRLTKDSPREGVKKKKQREKAGCVCVCVRAAS